MPFMMQDYYAGAKGAIELQQLQQEQQEQKDIASIYKQTTATQAPTGFGPGATAPSGGLASADALMGTQEDPLKASVNAIRSSTQELQGLDKQMQFNTQAAEVYRKNGKVVEANKLLAQNEALKEKQMEAQNKHLDNIKKSSEMMGGIAGAYIDQANDPTTEAAARIELINKARDILPPQKVLELSAMSPDQLKARLTQLRDGSMTAYQQAEARQKLINEQARIAQEDRLAKLNESQIKLNEARIAKLQSGDTSGAKGAAATAVERVVNSASQATDAIATLTNLDVTTTMPVYGQKNFDNIFTAPLGALNQSISDESAQKMQTRMAGVARSLASLETGGAATGLVGLTDKIEKAISIPAGATPMVVFDKLGEMRRIVESATKTALASNKYTPDQKDLIRANLEDVRRAVPFTQQELDEVKRKVLGKEGIKLSPADAKLSFTQYLNKLKGESQTESKPSTTQSLDDVLKARGL